MCCCVPTAQRPMTPCHPRIWTCSRSSGQRGTQLTGYPCVSTYHGFRYGPHEVTHGAHGRLCAMTTLAGLAFTTELWDLPTTAGIGPRDFIAWLRWHPEEDDLNAHALERCGRGRSRPSWTGTRFQHPQLGPVEIGGWHGKLYQQNAPLTYLPELVSSIAVLPWRTPRSVPMLSLRTVQVEPRGDRGCGMSSAVVQRQRLSAHVYQQEGPGAEVRATNQRSDTRPPRGEQSRERAAPARTLGHLEGRSNKSHGRVVLAAPRPTICARSNGCCKGPQGPPWT